MKKFIFRWTLWLLIAGCQGSVDHQTISNTPRKAVDFNPGVGECGLLIRQTSLQYSGGCRITRPGSYRVIEDLSYLESTGAAITIDADDVILNFQGHNLFGNRDVLEGKLTRAIGVYANGRRNISVVNSEGTGSVSFFLKGVSLENGRGGYRIQGLSLIRNYYLGIWGESPDLKIVHNQITETGGTMLTKDYTRPQGIVAIGARARVSDNRIDGFIRSTFARETIGIVMRQSPDASIIDNQITIPVTYCNSWGIWISDSDPNTASKVALMRNQFENLAFGVSVSGDAEANARDNVFISMRKDQQLTGKILRTGDTRTISSNESPVCYGK